jgi:hypothetical protein
MAIFSDNAIKVANQAVDDLIERIEIARVVYCDSAGREIVSVDLGHVQPGETITTQVPKVGDIKIV